MSLAPLISRRLKILVDSTGILTMMYYMAQQLPCQIKGLGLTGGEEPEQVFSELFLNVYVLKHRSKINIVDFLTLAILYWKWNKIQNMPFILR
ncbi:hypothetical protein OUZ56_010016 [Daphnia magna]|uniref:Uncharacterized protein n=1 Tax=Daphnia magna TaxID=35525 RepID=A0ABR0AHQ5_9CRUS|nr:hypothetical protein OUZ56_010016 [Daphnia magna]